MTELQVPGTEDWSTGIPWSNLYKIAPIQGNPSARLQNAQRLSCAELLLAELAYYRPSNVVMMTDHDWFEPFKSDWTGRPWRIRAMLAV